MGKNEYGLFTTIAMIVGIVIGSGIFFKCDDILTYTNGNIFLGVMVFVIAAVAIIFGCLTFAQLAAMNDEPGGFITYGEMCYGKTAACSLGWFQTFLYFPTIIAVISYFAAEYVCILFNIKATTEIMALIAVIILLCLYVINVISAKAGGIFQNATTVIKLIPLIIIAIVGMIMGNPSEVAVSAHSSSFSGGWLSAIVPIAFSYDGWIASTSIGHEVKDSKKNLPRALVIAPIFILLVYVSYFVGLSTFLGPDVILKQGNAHLYTAANEIIGSMGAKIIVVFVTISILGTLNGLIMAYIRQPYSLAIRGMLPKSNSISKINSKLDMPLNSGIIAYVCTMIWFAVHFVILESGVKGFDISEISITLNYVLFAVIYVKVLQYGIKKQIKGTFKGIVCPVLATLGSAVILLGSINSKLFWINTAICALILLSAAVFWKKQQKCIQ